MVFDCIIIGCGLIGASVSRYLSRYKGNILVLERHNDVGEETSSANSSIVHSGYDPKPGTLKAKFNVLGNKMMSQVSEELDVPFIRNGSLTVAFSTEETKTLYELKKRSEENGVECRIVETEELRKIEPNISSEAKMALLCPTAGIINPFLLNVGYIENAMDNGVKLRLNSEVVDIKYIDGLYHVYLKNGEELITKTIVNASGQMSDKIHSLLEEPRYKVIYRKGEYLLLDHFNANFVKHTLFMCPTKVGKGVLISPTTSYNYIIGPSNDESTINDTSTDSATFESLKDSAKKLIKNIPYVNVIREFAGVRANSSINDFIIEESSNFKGFFEAGGIMSPGLASSPAIGEYVSDLVASRLSLKKNDSFNPTIKKHKNLRNLGINGINELIKEDESFGRMICRCEKVSEGEIIDCIHRNAGATTVKGVKKRVRAGFGKCQGTFCQEEVVKILARELNTSIDKINYSEQGTNILKCSLKGNKHE